MKPLNKLFQNLIGLEYTAMSYGVAFAIRKSE